MLEEVQARGPRLIALFGQDSTSWTFDAFTRRFGAVVAASLLFRRSMRTGRHREAQERRVTASACWLLRGGAPRLPRSVVSEW